MKKFKRLVVLLFCMTISLGIYAGRVNESDALKKAQAFMPGQRFEMKKYASSSTGGAGQEPFYIFNVANGGGFVLVSADDQTVPILGYSTMGNIDLNNIPDNVSYWLESYAEQLRALEEGKLEVPKRNTQSTRGDIAPLIKTEWNQGDPYNLMCPDGNGVDYTAANYDSNNRTVSGCVATAVAQVMYYHKQPSQTTAIPAYTFDINGNSATLGELPATTLEWDKMKETYNGSESEESRNAVAKLMRYVGQAFKMYYDVAKNGGSGTWIYTDAMVEYFNYSKKIHEIYRDNYTTSQWEDLVYNELSHNRPVPYSGRTSGNAGHQFVCDGYSQSDGLFHLNWGWGGSLDGYFILSIADPDGEQGIGGGDGAFKYNQACVLNFMPAGDNEEEVPLFTSVINANILSKDYSRSSGAEDFTDVALSGQYQAMYAYVPTTTYDVEIGWGLYLNEDLQACVGSTTRTIDNRNIGANWYYTYNNSKNVSFGKGLADGKYQLRQIFRKAGSSDAWQLCDNYGTNYMVAEINGNTLQVGGIDDDSSVFQINSMSVSLKPYVGGTVTVNVNLTNAGETNKGKVCLWAAKDGTSDWENVANQMIYIDPGVTGTVPLTYVPNESGQYNLKITSGGSEEPLITTSIYIADIKEETIDGIKYQYIPEYGIATIVSGGSDRSKSSLTIPSAITVDGKECIVTTIGEKAFYNWWNLKTLTIPEGVETIGLSAFRYCGSLTKLELPSTLVSIGNYAFQQSSSLVDLVSHINTPFAISDNVFEIWDNTTQSYVSPKATLYVPLGTSAQYKEVSGWNRFATIIEGELKEAKVGDLYYSYATGGGSAKVIGGDYSRLQSVNIPATISVDNVVYKVTSIDSRAFNGYSNITSLTIADGVESIGDYAFNDNSFSELALPSSIRVIGMAAFESCGNLKSLVVPEGVVELGQYAFWNCNNMQKLELPSTLTSIGEQVINYCSSLSTVVSHIGSPFQISDLTFTTSQWNSTTQQDEYIPSSATLYVPIGTKSKYEAITGWTKFAKIEEGEQKEAKVGDLYYSYSTGSTEATVISGDYSNLENVTIGSSVTIDDKIYNVTAIANSAFGGCWNLKSVTIEEGLVSIGNNAFQGVNNISNLTLPSTLKSIGEYAFGGCSNLKQLVVPEGVERIGRYAFTFCHSLQKLELPSSLTSIGEYVIDYSNSLTAIVSKLTEPIQISDLTFTTSQWNETTRQYDNIPSSATLYVPIGTKSKYEAITGWTKFAKIEEGELKEATVDGLKYSYSTGSTEATVISGDYSNLESVTIGSSVIIDEKSYNVTAIASSAFSNCYKIKSVTIEKGLVSIGNYAFQGVNISNITLPSTLKSIGEYAFWYCNSLKSLVVPEGVEVIAERAFGSCQSLQKLELPSTLVSIGDFVITGSPLSSVVSRMTQPIQVGDNCFMTRSWNSTTEEEEFTPSSATLYVPAGTKSKYEAITGWTQFAKIQEGEQKEATVDGLRYSYSTGSAEATVISGDYSNLESVTISRSVTIDEKSYIVTAIANGAFRGCRNIKSVTIDEGILSIGNYAFQGVDISNLTLPSTLKSIGEYAFDDCYNLKQLVVPEGVERIGRYAFALCSSLQKLELPSTLTSIGEFVVPSTISLTAVVSRLTEPIQISELTFTRYQWNSATQQYDYLPSLATLYVPIGTKSKYEAIIGWTMFDGGIKELESTAKLGDANGDGKITISDAVLIISYVVGENPSGFNMTNADVNEDGKVTIADAVKVIDMITP